MHEANGSPFPVHVSYVSAALRRRPDRVTSRPGSASPHELGTVSTVIDQSGSTNTSAADAQTDDSLDSQRYPGETLGLPESGAGSLASMVRRVGAIFIDWFVCTFIVVALIRPAKVDVELWTLLVFALQDFVLTSLTGLTLGKRLVGIRVVRLDGRWIGPLWGLLRTVLLLLIIPALFMNADQRGLQDRAANTAVVRI
jgi:hypothetical protein